MEGVGDCIYQRPFIKQLIKDGHEVYLSVYLHELFSDIKGLKFLKPAKEHTYRTQQKQFDSQKSIKYDTPPPKFDKVIDPLYSGTDLIHDSIVYSMSLKFGVDNLSNLEWNLPNLSHHLTKHESILKSIPFGFKKIAIVRPSTIRSEWKVSTRSPDPTYIYWCAHVLHEAGYYVISIADVDGSNEWIEGPAPFADLTLHSGDLGIFGTLELLKTADVVIGGSGFIVPATVSAKVPLFILFGGRGAYDSPYKIFHPSMNLKKIGWAVPRNFCRCTLAEHACDKSIPDLDDKFMNFLRQIQYENI